MALTKNDVLLLGLFVSLGGALLSSRTEAERAAVFERATRNRKLVTDADLIRVLAILDAFDVVTDGGSNEVTDATRN